MAKSLYFIAILIPGEKAGELINLKHGIAEKYASFHALRTPPHITLWPPTAIEDEKWEELLSAFESLSAVFEAGEVDLGSVSSFPPRVIFIDVAKDPFIMSLQGLVMKAMTKAGLTYPHTGVQSFHPHVTLMTRDLKKGKYNEAMEELDGLRFDWKIQVDRIQLLRHDGKEWVVYKECKARN